MSGAAQYSLDLGALTRFSRESFLVGCANREALAWIDLWPNWPASSLVLEGPAGSGKTHLAAIWAARVGAPAILGRALDADAVPACLASGRYFVVDGAEVAPEVPLFHLLNAATEAGGGVLLLGRAPPARWGTGLPDLRSRLLALPLARIAAPEDTLIRAVLEKHFADRQIRVGADVIGYLLTRMERSFEQALDLASRLDRESLARRSPITVPLAKTVLDALDQPCGGTS